MTWAPPDPADVRKAPHEWCTELGIVIHDPDGWRGVGAPPMSARISRDEFTQRMVMSTISLRGPFTCSHTRTAEPKYGGGNYGWYGYWKCLDCGAWRDEYSYWHYT